MLLAAIVLWLLFALVFWCMMVGATRGDRQMEAALEQKLQDLEKRALVVDPGAEHKPLSNAA